MLVVLLSREDSVKRHTILEGDALLGLLFMHLACTNKLSLERTKGFIAHAQLSRNHLLRILYTHCNKPN